MKKDKGITLIALVITIIVLLILAGVSLSLVLGNNSILTRANQSTLETRKGNAKDQVSMAWDSVETEYLVEHSTNLSKQRKEFFNEDMLNKYLGEGTISNLNYNEGGKSTFTYTNSNDTFEMEIDETGKARVLGTAGTVTPSTQEVNAEEIAENQTMYYGKTVNYEANGITDWKIFYSDGTNIFLIASDYVPNSTIDTTKTGMSTTGTYQAYWSSVPSALDTTNRQDTLFMATGYTLNESNPSSKCVSKLLDTDNWSNFVNPDFAEYAIGGPTIEMWKESWNAKYPTDKIQCSPTASAPSPDGYGYKVDWESGSYSDNYILFDEMNKKDCYLNDDLYYPQKTIFSDCYLYWLASPTASYYDSVMCVCCFGSVDSNGCDATTGGVRPVVSLSSSVKLTEGKSTYDFDLN